MVEAMRITRKMYYDRLERIDEIIERVNACIRRAVERGDHKCCFDCSKYSDNDAPFYDDVRREFELAGYTIKPTGYIGGVWQRTEDISW